MEPNTKVSHIKHDTWFQEANHFTIVQKTEVEKELERRRADIIKDLRNALTRYRLVIVVGAGVTLGATKGPTGPLRRLTWNGLIENGLDYLVNEVYNGVRDKRIEHAYSALEGGDTEELLDAAMIMKDRLTRKNQYPTWLKSVFRGLSDEIRDSCVLDVLKVLHAKGAMLLTTNYDDILERHCGVQRIGRSNLADVLKFRSGDKDGVFHLHGSYEDPEEVVLDAIDYSEITHAEEVQGILKTCFDDRTVLFVGCGSGLEDPNFGALLNWVRERHKNIPGRHCLLLRDDDPLDVPPLRIIRVGAIYEKVEPFLRELLDHPVQEAMPVSLDSSTIDDLAMQKKQILEIQAEKEAATAREMSRLKAEEEKQRIHDTRKCQESLGFPEMTQRRRSANRAHPGTCSWILSHELYRKWLDLQCGLLWIKGNPGSGKSTIMAFLFEEMIHTSARRGKLDFRRESVEGNMLQREHSIPQFTPADDRSVFILSFFFHGRGSSLEKTQIGMFRSFLHQILAATENPFDPICDDITKAFLENDSCGQGWEWQLEEVQKLFSNSVMTIARQRKVRIIVDALDEAGAEAANSLLTYFHWLTKKMRDLDAEGRICISCRHYPILDANIPGYTIAVDGRNRDDITKYVEHEINLKIRAKKKYDETVRNDIIQTISFKAETSFQWACLITPMVIRYHRNGESLDWIQRQIAKVPPGLSQVYEHIFTTIIDQENMTSTRSYLLMQWISLAERRLSLTELHFAMTSENYIDRLPLPYNDESCQDNGAMATRVRSWSGGLAEVVYENNYVARKEATRQKGTNRISGFVQFIHQSVNDFLHSGGLSLLLGISSGGFHPQSKPLPTSPDTIIQQSHERLATISINYLGREEVQQSILRRTIAAELETTTTIEKHVPIPDALDALQFQKPGTVAPAKPRRIILPWWEDTVPDGDFDDFPVSPSWEDTVPDGDFDDFPVSPSWEDDVHPEGDSSDDHSEDYRTTHPFLMSSSPSFAPTPLPSENTIMKASFPFLSYAIDFWYVHARKAERYGASQHDIVRKLSSGIFDNFLAIREIQGSAKTNIPSPDGQKLVHFASGSNTKAILQQLLNDGQVNAKDDRGREALSYAIQEGHADVVALLLKAGADVDARMEVAASYSASSLAATPLQLAAVLGREEIISLLLKHGGFTRDPKALRIACKRKDLKIVNILLQHKWEVAETELYEALTGGPFQIFELLFSIRKDHLDLDFRYTGEPDSTMLHFAVRWGMTEVVRLLLDNGAKSLTPWAGVKLLLKYGRGKSHLYDSEKNFEEIKSMLLKRLPSG
jgi:predicted ATPase